AIIPDGMLCVCLSGRSLGSRLSRRSCLRNLRLYRTDKKKEIVMGELLKAYFVPNGSYLMQEDEDGIPDPSVDALRNIGREIREELKADVMIAASPHWQTKSGFFVD